MFDTEFPTFILLIKEWCYACECILGIYRNIGAVLEFKNADVTQDVGISRYALCEGGAMSRISCSCSFYISAYICIYFVATFIYVYAFGFCLHFVLRVYCHLCIRV